MGTDLDGLVVLQSMATRRLLEQVAPAFARETGRDLALRPMGGVEAARLVRAGGPADVVILAAASMRQLAAEGFVKAGSLRDIARAEMVVAVPAGAPRPDLSSGEAVRQTILSARRVAYSTGPSGDHLLALCAAWGIPADGDRFLKAPPGVPVGSLLARGEADLGFQQRSELVGVAGVDIVAALPSDVQATTTFTAGISATCRRAGLARALLDLLTSPLADDIKWTLGLEPA
jgi:molybdate transport system substrate-binding protein